MKYRHAWGLLSTLSARLPGKRAMCLFSSGNRRLDKERRSILRRYEMAKRQQSQESKGGPCVRQAAELGRILNDLQSPDAGTRAEAVRTLCPCRTQWDVPVQRYVSEMMNDPSSSVRHEAHHVLDEDSGWGKRLAARRLHAELKAEQANEHGD